MKRILIATMLILICGSNALAASQSHSRDRSIVLDEFAVRDMPLDEVLTKLVDDSVKADPDKLGVSIANLTKEPQRSMKVTISVRKKNVREILDLLAGTLGLWIHSGTDAVEVRNSSSAVKGTKP